MKKTFIQLLLAGTAMLSCNTVTSAQTDSSNITKTTNLKLKLTSIFVNDPVAAFKFYTEVLGFDSMMFMPEAALAIVVSSEQPNGTSLLLEPRGDKFAKTYQETVYSKGLPVIVFGSDDVYKEYERLKEKGVVFKQTPTKTEWGIVALFDDTCGNYIQIHQDL